jgi:hypothetical protein
MKFHIGFETVNFTTRMKFSSNIFLQKKQTNKGLINGKSHYIRFHFKVIFCVTYMANTYIVNVIYNINLLIILNENKILEKH